MENEASKRLLETIFGKQETSTQKPSPEATARLKKKLEVVLATLTYREREIIKLRYGLGDGYAYTLEEVAGIFRVTRERVRQIEAKGVRKLMHGMLEGSPESEENKPA